jgi:hypothetical protein
MVPIQQKIYEALAGFAALSALVGTRVYPDIAPQDVARPFVVWQEISLQQMNDMSGSAESSGLSNYHIQVTSWAAKATDARDLDKQVRLAMIAASAFKSLLNDSRAMPYESDTKLFGTQSDFSVWLKT